MTETISAAEAQKRVNNIIATCSLVQDARGDERLEYVKESGKFSGDQYYELRRGRFEVTVRLNSNSSWGLEDKDIATDERGDQYYVMRCDVNVSWPSYGSLPIFSAMEHASLLTEAMRLAGILQEAVSPGVLVLLSTKEERAENERASRLWAAKRALERLLAVEIGVRKKIGYKHVTSIEALLCDEKKAADVAIVKRLIDSGVTSLDFSYNELNRELRIVMIEVKCVKVQFTKLSIERVS